MTTIVAVKTNSGADAVVLASDTQLNWANDDGEPSAKQDFYKIFTGDHWAMADAGMSDSDLALATGTNRSTVHRWRNGTAEPSTSSLDAICRALKLDDTHAAALRRWFARGAA